MITTCPVCHQSYEIVLGGKPHNCPGPGPKQVTEAQFLALLDYLKVTPVARKKILEAKPK